MSHCLVPSERQHPERPEHPREPEHVGQLLINKARAVTNDGRIRQTKLGEVTMAQNDCFLPKA